MPANEDTYCDTLGRSQSVEDINDVSGCTNIFDKRSAAVDDQRDIMGCRINEYLKEELSGHLESTPTKAKHERFLRDFFEIVLQDAVFDVSVETSEVGHCVYGWEIAKISYTSSETFSIFIFSNSHRPIIYKINDIQKVLKLESFWKLSS